MQAALGLARRGLGRVWPNPAVGCVLVEAEAAGGRVVARGWTQPGGRPHAEAEALRQAGDRARGATAYLTLEPCAHHGKTPPCADALVAAGIGRAVVAIEDPDPRVAGRGLAGLRAAGIPVTTGLCAVEAEELNAGFLTRIREGRPLVTMKLATTLDGRIATHGGESQWITGKAARWRGHLLRATHDAILVGTGTVLADDPVLTCRLPGLEGRSPVRILLDRRLRTPLTARLIAGAREAPTWLVTLEGGDAMRRQVFVDSGVEVIEAPADSDGNLSLPAVLGALGARGVTRVLVEPGAHLAAALLRADLVDRIVWFRAPTMMGGDGLPAAVAFGVDRLADAPRFVRTGLAAAGADMLETYRRHS
ncbi:bifunctional diaminohydroxyphosphoribosylaminopyrimidine deaminase/5-amino-6-(5-phosphoribosylamino)uracil reductase RibD [Rhodospirillaceae bacterium SYSU D60014]|uniref:bifunctional diaminohydroxyphosphoribosylaminopyrimidine deaminase/5-amino-6-(5-phosphoribosylamino)uracil reductase RibD n=1 Tax=Virgifigura deserti TaxID=2268457 RepID=UPI000E671E89